MKSTSYKNSRKELNENIVWEAFKEYLGTTYFPEASELLDTKLVAFEYKIFRDTYFD